MCVWVFRELEDVQEHDGEMRNSDGVLHTLSISKNTLLWTRDLRSEDNICPQEKASACTVMSLSCRKSDIQPAGFK